jgi:hypothetical protein
LGKLEVSDRLSCFLKEDVVVIDILLRGASAWQPNTAIG